MKIYWHLSYTLFSLLWCCCQLESWFNPHLNNAVFFIATLKSRASWQLWWFKILKISVSSNWVALEVNRVKCCRQCHNRDSQSTAFIHRRAAGPEGIYCVSYGGTEYQPMCNAIKGPRCKRVLHLPSERAPLWWWIINSQCLIKVFKGIYIVNKF